MKIKDLTTAELNEELLCRKKVSSQPKMLHSPNHYSLDILAKEYLEDDFNGE